MVNTMDVLLKVLARASASAASGMLLLSCHLVFLRANLNILPSHFSPASGFGGELTVTYLSHPARGNLVHATLLAPATCRQS